MGYAEVVWNDIAYHRVMVRYAPTVWEKAMHARLWAAYEEDWREFEEATRPRRKDLV